MMEEGGHDRRPAMAEDADPPPVPAWLPGGTAHGRKRGDREAGLGLPTDGEQPPGGEGESQPQALHPRGIGHPRVAPSPAAPSIFILSAEIIVITLGIVAGASLATQLAVLTGVGLLMTVGVYGLVAGIVKLDDAGFYLQHRLGETFPARMQRRLGTLRDCIKTNYLIFMIMDLASSQFLADQAGWKLTPQNFFLKNQLRVFRRPLSVPESFAARPN